MSLHKDIARRQVFFDMQWFIGLLYRISWNVIHPDTKSNILMKSSLTNTVAKASSEDSDLPGHLPRLIRVFYVNMQWFILQPQLECHTSRYQNKHLDEVVLDQYSCQGIQ